MKHLNVLRGFGPFYWIYRDIHKGFKVSLGFMREANYPWRIGKGIQIGFGKYLFQFGLCKRSNIITETEGLLKAIQGRELNHTPKELREWK
jgi:hypothetical protein